jgi:hypothetical protein
VSGEGICDAADAIRGLRAATRETVAEGVLVATQVCGSVWPSGMAVAGDAGRAVRAAVQISYQGYCSGDF